MLLPWPPHLTNEYPKCNPVEGHPCTWPHLVCNPSLSLPDDGSPGLPHFPFWGGVMGLSFVVPQIAPGSSLLGAGVLHCTPTKATFVMLCMVAHTSTSFYKQIDHILPQHKCSRLMCLPLCLNCPYPSEFMLIII